MTTPEQTNDRPGDSGPSDEVQSEATDAGRPRIRPVPDGDREPAPDSNAGEPAAELDPDALDAGRPRIRPGPPGED